MSHCHRSDQLRRNESLRMPPPGAIERRGLRIAAAATVRVEHGANGAWEVELPDRHERVRCETLDDAQRIAYLCAAHAQPCELIVQDAYHRVVQRRLIENQPPNADSSHIC
jgi:hypothetical protein